jgi:hypothetical protein
MPADHQEMSADPADHQEMLADHQEIAADPADHQKMSADHHKISADHQEMPADQERVEDGDSNGAAMPDALEKLGISGMDSGKSRIAVGVTNLTGQELEQCGN